MRIKQWNLSEADPEHCRELSEATGLPLLVCKVLSSRKGDITADEAMGFLNEKIEFESPFILKDMDVAVERIESAIQKQEKIAIYGDYDCDGITATTLLMSYFQSVGADVFYYIPHRETEGYGLNIGAVDKLSELGTDLVITVDNGITSHNEIAHANEIGMDVIVTDHHTPRETLPEALAVVNPHREDCPSRFKDYAGVGVAFQLVCALEGAEQWELLDYYADIVAIGTIADLVPLVGENRAIVLHGLEMMNQTVRPGIKVLLDIAGAKSPITTENVSFGIAPRLNAAGRMDIVDQAVDMLLTDDYDYAKETAENLQSLNLQRRGTEEETLKEIRKIIEEHPEILLERVLIIHGEGWHQGVMGIVASRLTDRYGKPCIAFSVDGGIAKGSSRSLPGFSLIEAITACSEKLIHYGGHTLAAGMTLKEEDLPEFSKQIQSYAAEHYEIMPVPSYDIDAVLSMDELTIKNISSLDILAPFGAGNDAPVFLLKNLKLDAIYPTVDQKHLRLKLSSDGTEISAIYFRMTPGRFPYQTGDTLDAVVDIDINEWNGNLQLSIKIQDIRTAGLPEKNGIVSAEKYMCHVREEYGARCKTEELIPSRDELAAVYRYLAKNGGFSYGSVALWERLIDQKIDFARMSVALDIFEEKGLISRANGRIEVIPQREKVDLNQSQTLKQLQMNRAN